MPFKTRKQKESASARRFSFANNQVVWEGVGKSPKSVPKKAVDIAEVHVVGKNNMFENIFVASDLVKIFAIAPLIIALQLVLKILLY